MSDMSEFELDFDARERHLGEWTNECMSMSASAHHILAQAIEKLRIADEACEANTFWEANLTAIQNELQSGSRRAHPSNQPPAHDPQENQ